MGLVRCVFAEHNSLFAGRIECWKGRLGRADSQLNLQTPGHLLKSYLPIIIYRRKTVCVFHFRQTRHWRSTGVHGCCENGAKLNTSLLELASNPHQKWSTINSALFWPCYSLNRAYLALNKSYDKRGRIKYWRTRGSETDVYS